MLILLGLLALIFAHITYKDVKVRLVFRRDLIALVCLRIVALAIALIAEYCFEIESVLGFSVDQWGIRSFVLSVAMAFIICAFVQGVTYITNRLTNKYGAKEESLGLGDVKLYALCSLFLSVEGGLIFLFLSAIVGAVMALYCKVIKKQKTFPFAPAIVWSCFAVLIVESAGLL